MKSPPAYIRIHGERLVQNLAVLRRRVAPARVMPVLKGNAYGHGLEQVAELMARAGADWLGLATVAEARRIRAAGITTPLFLLYGPEPEEALDLLTLNVETAIWRVEQLAALADAARQHGVHVPVHLLVEISGNWLGVRPERLDAYCRQIGEHPELEVRGICAHVWNGEDMDGQIAQFEQMVSLVRSFFPGARLLHIANSAALHGDARSRLDIVRPGIALYGAGNPGTGDPALEQAMQVLAVIQTVVELPAGSQLGYARVTAERDSRLAILGLGYSHGLDPGIVQGGVALVRGLRCPIVSVGMGMTVVDVSALTPVPQAGLWTCLLGSQAGETISVLDVAAVLGASPYEVLTRFCAALPHYYEFPYQSPEE